MFNFLKKKEDKFVSSETFRIIEMSDRDDQNAKKELNKLFDKGLTAEEHNKFRRVIYSKLANEGDSFGMYWMGFISSVIDRDPERALYWYLEAAEKGNVEAMKALAFGYSEIINENDLGYGSVGFGYDKTKEYYWLHRAAECGDEKSWCDLGDYYYYESDLKNAFYWYNKALLSKDMDIEMKAKKGLENIKIKEKLISEHLI